MKDPHSAGGGGRYFYNLGTQRRTVNHPLHDDFVELIKVYDSCQDAALQKGVDAAKIYCWDVARQWINDEVDDSIDAMMTTWKFKTLAEICDIAIADVQSKVGMIQRKIRKKLDHERSVQLRCEREETSEQERLRAEREKLYAGSKKSGKVRETTSRKSEAVTVFMREEEEDDESENDDGSISGRRMSYVRSSNKFTSNSKTKLTNTLSTQTSPRAIEIARTRSSSPKSKRSSPKSRSSSRSPRSRSITESLRRGLLCSKSVMFRAHCIFILRT